MRASHDKRKRSPGWQQRQQSAGAWRSVSHTGRFTPEQHDKQGPGTLADDSAHRRAHASAAYLYETAPELSAFGGLWLWQRVMLTGLGVVFGAGFWLRPELTAWMGVLCLAIAFALIVGLRALALGHAIVAGSRSLQAGLASTTANEQLPVYSVLVPLFHEAEMVPQIVRALSRLDYPADRLEIILVLEEVDHETLASVTHRPLPASFRYVVVPDVSPRTKPKALNYALRSARGEFVVIYDAEDIPEAGQLRRAVAAFHAGPAELACVQARLDIVDRGGGWLSRQFALEYLALFRGTLPALEAFGLPMPLGGTSNHFRVSLLKRVGGWDPHNVTEDADLGVRLKRKGYRCAMLVSSTAEDAPLALRDWFKQRTRWIKGWMQTYAVHTRRPFRALSELGLAGSLGLHAILGGLLLSALVHPFFYLMVANELWQGRTLMPPDAGVALGAYWLAAANLGVGYGAAILLSVLTALRAGRPLLAVHAIFIPVYWLLISAAAWRALWQFFRKPYYWEKTRHRPLGAGRPG